MDDGVCPGLDGDACRCFAANQGGSCIYCAGSRACRSAMAVREHEYGAGAGAGASLSWMCGSAAERRALAARCGAQAPPLNLAVAAGAPASITQSLGVLAPWSGALFKLDLGAVFQVQGVSVVRGAGAGAALALALAIEPASPMRPPSAPCRGNSCLWSLERVPFLSNMTLAAVPVAGGNMSGIGSSGSTVAPMLVSLQQLVVPLAPFAPLDGTLAPAAPWSACNNSCGEGVRTRTFACVQPAFGGLPCQADGRVVLHNTTLTRPCASHTDCGTNWAVMAVVGWWQLLLLVVFFSRKTLQAIKARRNQQQIDNEHHTRRLDSLSFDADADDDEARSPRATSDTMHLA
jgi:hypothetical protein